jgi:hypothetical protein
MEGECRLPRWARSTLDGMLGVDNSLGAVIQSTRNTITDFSSENYSDALKDGATSVIIQVSDWNGRANDTQVQLDIFIAAPFASFGAKGPDGGPARPEWMGQDEWPIASDSVLGGDKRRPRFSDKFAYVNDYRLVANLSESLLRLDVGFTTVGPVKLAMSLTSATSLCTLEETTIGNGWRLKDCVLGGRWSANHLLQQLSQFPDPSTAVVGSMAGPLCVNSTLYTSFKDGICAATDIYSGNSTVASVCDSISMGVTFQTQPGFLGNVFTLDRVDHRCPDAVDPQDDDCDPDLSHYLFNNRGYVGRKPDSGIGDDDGGGTPDRDAGTDASQ